MSRPAHHNRRGLSIWRANHFDGVCVSELVCHLANMQFTINFEFQTIQLLCAKESENYLQVKWLHRYDICVHSDVLVSHEHTICFGLAHTFISRAFLLLDLKNPFRKDLMGLQICS